MPRACSICTHAKAGEIDKALLDGVSYRNISEHFGLKPTSISRHKTGHIPQLLAENVAPATVSGRSETKRYAETKRNTRASHALDLFQDFIQQLERMKKLSEAVDQWLRDPDDPGSYDIGPRAENVTVVYTVQVADDAPPIRRKAALQELLDRIETNINGASVVSFETKYADPRELLGKTALVIDKLGHTIEGVLEKAYNAEQVERFTAIVLTAIAEEAPDVGARIDDNIRRQQARSGLPGATIW